MRQVLDVPINLAPALPQARNSTRAEARTPQHDAGAARIWRETWLVLSAHTAPVLGLAVLGFALPMLLGLAAQRMVTLEASKRGDIFAFERSVPAAWVVQLVAALAGAAFVRGALTRVALHGESSRAACSAAMARLPALLTGALIYAAVIVPGAVCMNLVLSAIGLDAYHVGRHAVTPEGMAKLAAKRSLDLLVLDAVIPHDWVDDVRVNGPLSTHHVERHSQSYELAVDLPIAPSDDRYAPAVWTGLALLVAGHVLLRFRTVAAFDVGGANPLRALGRCLSLSASHCGWVAGHSALLHGALWIACAAFVIAPATLSDNLVVWKLAQLTGRPEWTPTLQAVMAGSASIVLALAWAIEAIYDARLYAALKGGVHLENTLI